MEPSASSSRLTFSAGQVSSRSPLVGADVVYVALAHLGLASEGSEALGSLEVWKFGSGEGFSKALEVEDCETDGSIFLV